MFQLWFKQWVTVLAHSSPEQRISGVAPIAGHLSRYRAFKVYGVGFRADLDLKKNKKLKKKSLKTKEKHKRRTPQTNKNAKTQTKKQEKHNMQKK